jgi:hypothetical protein
MHVYCAPLSSTLCKLAPDRWDIPMMRFCTCFSLPLLRVLYPVCDNTSNNNFLVKFQDWPIHSYICCCCLHSACILRGNIWQFWWSMCDAIGQSRHTKEIFVTFTRHQWTFWHEDWPFVWYFILLKTNAVIHEVDCKIDLKIVTAKVLFSYRFNCLGPFPALLTRYRHCLQHHCRHHRHCHCCRCHVVVVVVVAANILAQGQWRQGQWG